MSSERRRAPSYQHIFANAFNLQVSLNDVYVNFGFVEDLEKPLESIIDMATLVMSPTSAKLLSTMLSNTIAAFEKENGEIALRPETEEKLKNVEIVRAK